jgi:hypothetical protein
MTTQTRTEGSQRDALTKIDALIKDSRVNTDALPKDSVTPYDKGWDDATSRILDKLAPLVAAGLADGPATEGNWVFQEILRTEEALDAVPDGATIRTERPRAGGSLFFEKAGKGFIALDPADRQDGEDLVSSGAVLRWMSTGFAVVIDLPSGDRNGDAPGVNL